MKTFVAGLLILVGSISVWGNATKYQIQRAQEVLKRSILPTQLVHMSPQKLNTYMQEATYQVLRPRDILLLTEDQQVDFERGSRIIYNRDEGFSSDKNITLRKGEFLRIIQMYKSNDTDFGAKKDFSGVQAEYIEVLEFNVVKLDKNFEPVGPVFHLVARGKTDRKVPGVKRFDGGFMVRNPSLYFSHAGLGDVIVNAQAVKTPKGTIPAFSPAIIVKTERTRMKWTISNYRYVLTLHLINCPEQFKTQKCEVQIPGVKSYPDPIWARYAMPENRRIIKFWGGELHY
ncbi:MAG: hypothetical protein NDI63_08110 [Pseudobdellovibrio sp.]|nr:hypothetical protein [Pseudobdellovibrio sp.]